MAKALAAAKAAEVPCLVAAPAAAPTTTCRFEVYGWAAMMNNQFQGHPNGEAKLFLDANGTAITVLDFYGLRGPVLGDKWACIGMLVAIFAVFFTCGLGVLSNIRHERM